jgi:peptidoglycan-associated lipoprotein
MRTSAARAITSRSARDAQAVHDYLVAKGVTASRIKTISYGEERLVATYDDGSCRSQNSHASRC